MHLKNTNADTCDAPAASDAAGAKNVTAYARVGSLLAYFLPFPLPLAGAAGAGGGSAALGAAVCMPASGSRRKALVRR